ncbi:variant surface glycoprotein (VSG)-related, putative [Trypanosoma brucei brucei TREU927]|uniref:Variant surface glycoprotein (VSG)-related, putative n=1 Tax=Trypanosoma brucei brucei (strain 927/4 GUTat10.1) TaxID=185431 RepID=Q57XG7_TRYB2|nr:variant surface glycoprotein (VSG)-related, putative [Trypanosoma brucei brucei TREU927]AAX69702.1 variant surface glycoprotein (VSG)-related, putative [Trypanosoma brucei]AAZ11138.1 variant surface glycoprotein (VSG)-related, putative [Trypanosoma brucei brucei TREU927]
MWKKSVESIVGVSLVMTCVSSAEQDILNVKEFQTLCGFVSLTEQINELLERMKGKLGVDVTSLQIKAKDILFGANVDGVNKMLWKVHREMDCGQDSGNQRTHGGKALVRDLICLCEGTNRQPDLKDLCYTGNVRKVNSQEWPTTQKHRSTWDDLRSRCITGSGKGVPSETEFHENKVQFRMRIKKRKNSDGRQHFYTYGGGKEYGLHTCNGAESENDGICVLYPRGSNEDNASGIEWLNKLEDLVREVEEMSKDESASGSTKPRAEGKPSMEKNPKPNTVPSTGDNSPAKGTEGPQNDGNPNAQATTSSEKDATTTRPPEEQKSSSKTILQFLRIFLFWLFA